MSFFSGRRQEKTDLEYDYEPRFNERNGRSAPEAEPPVPPVKETPVAKEAPAREATAKAAPAERTERAARKGAKSPDECSTVVSAGSKWQGNLSSDASVRIDGELSGEIKAKDTVYVSENSRVDATIVANYVIIAGNFQGRVNCAERLELMPTSKIKGELTTKALMVHEGAFIDGALHMTSSNGERETSTTMDTLHEADEPAAATAPARPLSQRSQ
ncbi:MAG TPA: polymer-forming cytoskeletal protein [Dehalococcoidia bacterium]|nr:polymer-forming cytoskeletal protein [Dehalococcoidia bacterium]